MMCEGSSQLGSDWEDDKSILLQAMTVLSDLIHKLTNLCAFQIKSWIWSHVVEKGGGHQNIQTHLQTGS